MARRLYRSQRERIIGGVAGGIGEYFDIDPVWVRLAFILLIFAGGFGFIAYIALWIIVPRQTSQSTPREAIRENIQDIKQDLKQAEAGLKEALSRKDEAPKTTVQEQQSAPGEKSPPAYWVGLILIALGAVFLISNLVAFRWFKFWPVLVILAGVVLLLARRRK